jgi:hypothetical protein
MEVFEVIKKRRSIRKYKGVPVEEDKINKIIEAAILAPSDKLSSFRNRINSFFIPKSLDNLIKCGRINKIKGKFATLLEIKPILTLTI